MMYDQVANIKFQLILMGRNATDFKTNSNLNLILTIFANLLRKRIKHADLLPTDFKKNFKISNISKIWTPGLSPSLFSNLIIERNRFAHSLLILLYLEFWYKRVQVQQPKYFANGWQNI